jgi:hypothetical protein
MHDVVVTDNKCAPVSFVSGDTNGNNLLDPSETWAYVCQTNIPVSTWNVATAKGSANGFTALGYAFATVLVATPGLPNTGFPNGTSWDVIILVTSVLMLVLISFVSIAEKSKA